MNIQALHDVLSDQTRLAIVNLGCARNLVDSQIVAGVLERLGHQICPLESAQAVILNTCGFIADAKQESVDAILDLVELKKKGKIEKIVVFGCLSQRYKEELSKEFKKEVDALFGVLNIEDASFLHQHSLNPPYLAYLKICESCYNHCSFCAIPGIKGKFVSRAQEDILAEARMWDHRGVKELNIIGQDTTAYGMDIYGEKKLASLLRSLARSVEQISWIRLLYTFPAHVTDELIEVIAQESKICKYIDLPLQHVNDRVLKAMNRNITRQQTEMLIRKIRAAIPGVAIRTAFIVGFPGETEAEFAELLNFVREMRFEKLGAFVYSPEEGTPAFDLPNRVSKEAAQQRFDALMREQQKISLEVNQNYVGKILPVIIDEKQATRSEYYLGRTQFDAPDVDGTVHVYSAESLLPGRIVQVEISDATEYDLAGEIVS